MIGTRIVVPQGVTVNATYLRGGTGFGSSSTLPSGKYIVDDYDTGEEGDSKLRLADADWNDFDGSVHYHSNKHIYEVRRCDLVVTIDLLTANVKVEVKV